MPRRRRRSTFETWLETHNIPLELYQAYKSMFNKLAVTHACNLVVPLFDIEEFYNAVTGNFYNTYAQRIRFKYSENRVAPIYMMTNIDYYEYIKYTVDIKKKIDRDNPCDIIYIRNVIRKPLAFTFYFYETSLTWEEYLDYILEVKKHVNIYIIRKTLTPEQVLEYIVLSALYYATRHYTTLVYLQLGALADYTETNTLPRILELADKRWVKHEIEKILDNREKIIEMINIIDNAFYNEFNMTTKPASIDLLNEYILTGYERILSKS